MKLGNYVSGAWVDGGGGGTPLVDPVLGDCPPRIRPLGCGA